jgi:uncharacterized protein YjbI with pentapeptide repeats
VKYRMANQQQLHILTQGVEAWNRWREEHQDIEPDLQGARVSWADLHGAQLGGADLCATHFFRVDLSRADLRGAHLHEAHLCGAHLRGAHLNNTDLSKADLCRADLSRADLRGADLTEADLSWADLRGADLTGAHLDRAQVGWTLFGDVDLSRVKGLETVKHRGPSTVGIDTIYRSQGKISEVFLKGTGTPDGFVAYLASLVGEFTDYSTCFISYSRKDQAFAEQLYADLQSQGVRCWLVPEDLKIDDPIRPRIEELIRLYDKLVLVLSEHSMASSWIAHEVERALNKEREGTTPVFYAIRLDDAVMRCKTGWADDIRRTRHIADFTRWTEPDEYQKALSQLVQVLKEKKERGEGSKYAQRFIQ